MFVQAAWLNISPQQFLERPGVDRALPVIAPSRFVLVDSETGELTPDPDPEDD